MDQRNRMKAATDKCVFLGGHYIWYSSLLY